MKARRSAAPTSIDDIHLQYQQAFSHNRSMLPRLHSELAATTDPATQVALRRQIDAIESSHFELSYLLKAGPSLIRYMNGSAATQHECFVSYVKSCAPLHIPSEELIDRSTHDTWCYDCRCEKVITTPDSASYVCPRCGDTTLVTTESERPSFKDPPTDNSSQDYDRIGHFRDWLMYKQGRENTRFAPELFPTLEEEIAKEGITNRSTITHEQVHRWLKKNSARGFNRYFEHVPLIHYKLTGICPKRMTREQEMYLCDMFIRVQPAYEKHKPSNRKSCISYSYLLRKFCELLGYDDWVEEFRLVKDRSTLYELDTVWRLICEELGGSEAGWTFHSSF
jgi:predicted RNA-binding Zn-ribbon protein involved in translation (DUF1610 family)